MISKTVFFQGIIDLQLAFRVDLTEGQFSFFYEKLSPMFNDGGFTATVGKIIETERFFPAISVFIQCMADDGEKQLSYIKSLGYES